MPTLANSLRRIGSAKNRIPHLTGWGIPGSQGVALQEAALARVRDVLLEFNAVLKRTAPTIVPFVLNVFR
jgi:hypothetical protein